jgi:hypothetical protein
MRRTIVSLSAAATPVLPARDQPVDVSSLRVGERRPCDEPADFCRIVVLDCRLEMLALWSGLSELSA